MSTHEAAQHLAAYTIRAYLRPDLYPNHAPLAAANEATADAIGGGDEYRDCVIRAAFVFGWPA